jgi:ABC-type Mn2+/Zn2+ transport system permease subunit
MRYKSLVRIALAGTVVVIVIEVLREFYRLSNLDYLAAAILIGTFSLGVIYWASPSRRSMRTTKAPSQGFWALSGLGTLFLLFLSVPVLALTLFLAGSLLLLGIDGLTVSAVVLSVSLVWLFIAGRAFAIFYLEPLVSGFVTHWPRLNVATFRTWDEVRLFHLFGPVFAVGIPWLFPLTWFVVPKHKSLLAGIHDHLVLS